MSVEKDISTVAGYWDGHPDPLPANATPEQQAAFAAELGAWEAKFGDGGPPSPPPPPTIPGPALPGGGMPAARLGDLSAHAGPILGPGLPKVIVQGRPIARVGDQVACPIWDGLVPHVSGTILKGSQTVLIGGIPAARVSDSVGPPGNCKGNAIALGCTKVLIGEKVGAGPGSGAGQSPTALADDGPPPADSPSGGDPSTPAPCEPSAPARPAEPAGPAVVEIDKGTHWLEIELVDERDTPVAGEAFEVRLPDGKRVQGATDGDGLGRITGIAQPGWCSVSFPRLDVHAWERWSPAWKERPTAPLAPSSAESPPGAIAGRDGAAGRGTWRRVQRGECLSSIAAETGHAVNTIWNHDQNALLQARRRDPNVLHTGDAVFVPNLRQRTETAATDQRHKFRRIGVTTTIKVRVLGPNGPRAGEPYTLDTPGGQQHGVTTADGYLEAAIPPRARRATLRIATDEYVLALGALDPLSETTGVQQRLNNLGFACGPVDGRLSPRTIGALNLFRLRAGLPTSATLDAATLKRLGACHDQLQPLPAEPDDVADHAPAMFAADDAEEFDEAEEVY